MPAQWDRVPRLIAHRGASAEAPENTLASFRRALELGVRAIELDVHLTADEVPVVIHDHDVERTTNGHGPVSGFTLEALRALDAGAWYAKEFAGERVPTLEEVLRLAREHEAVVNIELKPPERDGGMLVTHVGEIVSTCGMMERVAVTSFDAGLMGAFHQQYPGVPTGLIRMGEPDPDELKALAAGGAVALGLFCECATPDVVREVQAHGLRVLAWTVNDPAEARRLLDSGVDGVITDHPRALLPLVGG